MPSWIVSLPIDVRLVRFTHFLTGHQAQLGSESTLPGLEHGHSPKCPSFIYASSLLVDLRPLPNNTVSYAEA